MTHMVRVCNPFGTWSTVFVGSVAQCESFITTAQGWVRMVEVG